MYERWHLEVLEGATPSEIHTSQFTRLSIKCSCWIWIHQLKFSVHFS